MTPERIASEPDASELVSGALAGDTRSIARILTHIEDASPTGRQLFPVLFRRGGSASTIGVTGAPGSGKSTLVSALVPHLVGEGKLAIVAVDPSSPFTGGAILGDRIRMSTHSGDERVYIRSLANRGSLGGISDSTPAVVAALDGLGFADVIVETVGVGQSEVEIASTADTTVVVVSPGWGDAIQASKAGLLEIADIFVVNKADQAGTDVTVRDLVAMLSLGPERGWTPPVIETVATDGAGVDALGLALRDHSRYLEASGERAERRRRQATQELAAAIRQTANAPTGPDHERSALIAKIADRSLDPWTAAVSVLSPP